MGIIIRGKSDAITIRREGNRVLFIVDGRVVFDAPYQAALQIASVIHAKAKEAEEEANAHLIIADQALLTRLGIPFGLTNRKDMLRAAANEAAWNSNLRRYIPPSRAKGVASQEVFGTPTITNKKR
jgi:hypothetical protein